jgi:hypothetical protein
MKLCISWKALTINYHEIYWRVAGDYRSENGAGWMTKAGTHLFATASILALGPQQSLIQYILGPLLWGIKGLDHKLDTHHMH